MGRNTKLNRKIRRRERHEKRKASGESYKQEMWDSGKKLIEPEYSSCGYYPEEYSIELGQRLVSIITSHRDRIKSGGVIPDPNKPGEWLSENDQIIFYFRKYRQKIRDFLILYNPNIPETPEFLYLKKAIETYWDNPDGLLSVL